VQDDASTPHVYLWPIASVENLWSHVTPAADHFREPIPWLEEHREAEVDGLERRVLRLVHEQEVLRLQVPVHHSVLVAQLQQWPDWIDDGAQRQRMNATCWLIHIVVGYLHDLDDGASELGGGALGVVPAREDAIEELAALAELHDEVHPVGVLAGVAEPHHGAPELRHAPRDLHLPAHVDGVGARAAQQQAPPPDGLARQRLPRGDVLAPPRDAELPAPELRAQPVPPREVRVNGAGPQDGGVLPVLLPALPLRHAGGVVVVVVVGGAAAARVLTVGNGEDGRRHATVSAQHLQPGDCDDGVAATHGAAPSGPGAGCSLSPPLPPSYLHLSLALPA
jgi:hypothetical protein